VSYPGDTQPDFRAKVVWQFSPPIVWRKPNPIHPKRYWLDMAITGIFEHNGSAYVTEHALNDENGIICKIGRSDWADWSHAGDLLFAKDGYLYRMKCRRGSLVPLNDAIKIVNFSGLKFESVEAPDFACRWPKR
jgi:hypothetical protein